MKITVTNQILAGNMGDGWKDGAADAYGDFVAEKLRERVRELYPDADIVVETDIQNASGYSRGIQVDSDDIDAVISLEDDLATVNHYAWDEWCNSDHSAEYGDE